MPVMLAWNSLPHMYFFVQTDGATDLVCRRIHRPPKLSSIEQTINRIDGEYIYCSACMPFVSSKMPLRITFGTELRYCIIGVFSYASKIPNKMIQPHMVAIALIDSIIIAPELVFFSGFLEMVSGL